MNMAQLSDQEIVALAARFGPGIIGPELHARAKRILKHNPGGAFGPALVSTEPVSAKAPQPESQPAPKGRKRG